MSGTISEIDKLLGMAHRKRGAGSFMSKVAHCRGIAALDAGAQSLWIDRACPASVPVRFKFPFQSDREAKAPS